MHASSNTTPTHASACLFVRPYQTNITSHPHIWREPDGARHSLYLRTANALPSNRIGLLRFSGKADYFCSRLFRIRWGDLSSREANDRFSETITITWTVSLQPNQPDGSRLCIYTLCAYRVLLLTFRGKLHCMEAMWKAWHVYFCSSLHQHAAFSWCWMHKRNDFRVIRTLIASSIFYISSTHNNDVKKENCNRNNNT